MTEPRRPGKIAGESAGAALGGLVAALAEVSGADPAVAATVGGAVGPWASAWLSLSAAELRRRGPVVAKAAAASGGFTEDDLLARMTSDADLQPLVQRILEAVGRTGDERKLQALGSVLGEAIKERPRALDESILIVQTIDALQSVHVRMMDVLEQQPERDPDGSARMWNAGVLEDELPDVSRLGVQGALAGLVALGLARSGSDTGMTFGTSYRLTDYGRAMLEVTRGAACKWAELAPSLR